MDCQTKQAAERRAEDLGTDNSANIFAKRSFCPPSKGHPRAELKRARISSTTRRPNRHLNHCF